MTSIYSISSLFVLASSILLTACSSGDAARPGDDPEANDFALPDPGEGVQYRMFTTVQPGVESYGCQLFVAPPEGLYVRREEVKFSAGGHHALLYRTPYAAIPDKNERGEPVDAASVHDCSGGATSAWRVNGVLGGSESFEGPGLLDELPEGVAVAIEPGTVLLMSTHYLNATPDAVEVDSRINLYTMPKGEVEVEAGVLYFDNHVIRVPANGKATARMRCPVPRDISIVSLQSHMHSRGAAFLATVRAPTGAPPKEVYSTDEWLEPPLAEFSPALRVAAGSSIEYRCSYRSAEPRDVLHGLTEADEMCQLIGPYFPRDKALEACSEESGAPAATWFGSGRATCGETRACLKSAAPFDEDGGASMYRCVAESCPGAAEAVSELVRCELSRGRGECAAACAAPGAQCDECLSSACAGAAEACEAADCGRL